MQVGSLVVAAAAALLLLELWRLYKALQSRQWHATDGEILDVRLERGLPFQLGVARPSGEERSDVVSPVVRYRYRVYARTFEGRRLHFGPGSIAGYIPASSLVDGMRRGGTITVYYNPKRPQDSVLLPGPTRLGYGLIASYLVLIASIVLPMLL